MKSNRRTVTIGIPAHDEEASIRRLLDSIVKQRATSYVLKSVVVACDNCTDGTAEIVREYHRKYPWITVIDDHKRLGQAGRLNNFYADCKSDIFITFDADTVLANKNVVEEIVKAFKDPEVGLVGGLDMPARPNSIPERIIVSGILLWHTIRTNFNNGVNVHNHQGRISALSRDMYQQVRIPAKIIANDEYLYFAVLKLGKKFRFASKAVVYYKEPTTFADFFKQSTRFITNQNKIEKHFGSSVKEYYAIPLHVKIISILKAIAKDPIYTPLGIGTQVLLRLVKPFYKETNKKGGWSPASSTKTVQK